MLNIFENHNILIIASIFLLILMYFITQNNSNKINTSAEIKMEPITPNSPYNIDTAIIRIMSIVEVRNRLAQYRKLNYPKNDKYYHFGTVGSLGSSIPATKYGYPILMFTGNSVDRGQEIFLITLMMSEVDEGNSPAIIYSYNPKNDEIKELKMY